MIRQLADRLLRPLAKQWRDSLHDDQMKERAAWLARQASNDWKLTSELHHADISLLVGSDSLDPFVFPGESLHKELVERGFVEEGWWDTLLKDIEAQTRGV